MYIAKFDKVELEYRSSTVQCKGVCFASRLEKVGGAGCVVSGW